jgi:glycine/D-amino acid oxidase-like deaminating enzyme
MDVVIAGGERLPPGARCVPFGAIWVAADEDEMAEVYRSQRFYTERDTPLELLDGQSLAEAEPNLRAVANISAIRTWTGFRAATPDKLLADFLLDRESAISREPY